MHASKECGSCSLVDWSWVQSPCAIPRQLVPNDYTGQRGRLVLGQNLPTCLQVKVSKRLTWQSALYFVSEYIVDRTGNSKNIRVWAAEWFACSSENGLYTGHIDLYTQLLPWFSSGLKVEWLRSSCTKLLQTALARLQRLAHNRSNDGGIIFVECVWGRAVYRTYR